MLPSPTLDGFRMAKTEVHIRALLESVAYWLMTPVHLNGLSCLASVGEDVPSLAAI